ncbi:MAG: chemotaxis protein CheX [Planctomycetes bacterium]|nr:chemotaxis protein CheX [Planctomycetota bacterium]NUQ33818.1 chemotaxis protein CheX [Planctomycetaceae bacterium]
MKVEYLNAFVQAALTTCVTMLGTNASHGQLVIKKAGTQTTADITAVLGLSGKVRGSIVLAFDHDSAEKYIAKFLGMNGKLSDGDICDGVGELCNIIGGSAKVELNKFGLNLTISIPNVVTGKGMQVVTNQSYPTLVVPFQSELGLFTLEVCLMD